MLLDDLLVREAKKRGARFRIGTDIPEAKIIVGAWGRWGRLDNQLARSFVRDRSHRNFGFKRHYTGPGTSGTIELYSFGRGYLGVNDVEGGITNICGLVHASRLTGHKGRWDAFVETIRAEEPALEALYARHVPAQEQFLSSEPVIFRSRSAVEGGIFMIGDASGVIDPLTGNGMAMAIQSALLAAPVLLRLLESPAKRPELEAEYRTRHHRFFAPRIAWSRGVAQVLSRPRLLDAALATLRGLPLGQLFLRRTRASRDEVLRLTDAWFC
jgi:flavin-dependent dehydrogenase